MLNLLLSATSTSFMTSPSIAPSSSSCKLHLSTNSTYFLCFYLRNHLQIHRQNRLLLQNHRRLPTLHHLQILHRLLSLYQAEPTFSPSAHQNQPGNGIKKRKNLKKILTSTRMGEPRLVSTITIIRNIAKNTTVCLVVIATDHTNPCIVFYMVK